MEDLNKQQLILLTLLVSFVTSIATGIITFTLLQEAPVEVTNTINRVVEKTIEQVTPADNGKTTTKEVQVVNEEDLVLSSIDNSVKSIVRIQTHGADGTDFVSGLGLVISKNGIVMLDSRSYNPSEAVYVIFPDGRSYSAEKVYSDSDTGLVFIKLSMTGHDVNNEPSFVPATLGDSAILKLGQSIINIAGKTNNTVNMGHVSELKYGSDGKTISRINSDIRALNPIPGSIVLNLSGEIVGLEAPVVDGDMFYSFSPVNPVKTAINNAITQLGK